MTTFLHDPDALLDYVIDWTPWLATGETIVSATWELDPELVQPDGKPASTDGKKCTIWLTGGRYTSRGALVTVHVVTSQGREDDRTMRLNVTDR